MSDVHGAHSRVPPCCRACQGMVASLPATTAPAATPSRKDAPPPPPRVPSLRRGMQGGPDLEEGGEEGAFAAASQLAAAATGSAQPVEAVLPPCPASPGLKAVPGAGVRAGGWELPIPEDEEVGGEEDTGSGGGDEVPHNMPVISLSYQATARLMQSLGSFSTQRLQPMPDVKE